MVNKLGGGVYLETISGLSGELKPLPAGDEVAGVLAELSRNLGRDVYYRIHIVSGADQASVIAGNIGRQIPGGAVEDGEFNNALELKPLPQLVLHIHASITSLAAKYNEYTASVMGQGGGEW